ncbi:MAG: 23S rRNA (adenine(2503)-C(2))-methyltransferase RlmN [Candidatus Edwardsbacteria bacterium]|nr:23S rRNA (adenine(2503)-C(2))-methyltransferase RlmN [Candidatus Edwardsbacteria bacterium]MBU1577488.1 23S rRNA (adenine(2503)-C(2))-methyltransferase RlmN [Candidatus Edwardsbacteria bacterium]MBU2462677.1 23S rRNA (adenine(2503)-C(2))-methyltransferase RlmN [Candidatus Edwardsbacteria bacterium]MBU2594841.1 23S rRNA (adenine(2503)-C(2))-methyltransferase RlmN [Candidatus Edwardsbacteria bacterium]
MKKTLAPLGARAFHARQIMAWFYQRGVSDFSKMTDLSKELRNNLEKYFRPDEFRLKTERRSRDGSRKILLETADGQLIESVLIPSKERLTACLSTQLGCKLNCGFCATGTMGFVRNLTAGEIADQLFHLQSMTGWKNRITNIVFMGMGEPMLNYDATLSAARLINSHQGFNIGARHITISTSGIVPGILRLMEEPEQFKLAISLSASTDAGRSKIMPVNKKYPLKELLTAARDFSNRKGKLVFFEYILLAGINDSLDDADRLAKLLKNIPAKVNLIPYNPGGRESVLKPSSPQVQQAFFERLHQLGVTVTVRISKGQDINAACGQLKASVLSR